MLAVSAAYQTPGNSTRRHKVRARSLAEGGITAPSSR
jgi:hypothetical protein